MLNLALLQLLPGKNPAENREKGLRALEKAKAMGADIALFPEMWSCGYELSGGASAIRQRAIDGRGEWVRAFGEAARRLKLAVGVTLLEAWEPQPRNTLVLFDCHGREVLCYAKVHTCDFGEERDLTPGEIFPTAALDTAQGKIQVGAMICYDREFPESARLLMLGGAELILVPNACPMELNRLSQLRARAFENMTAIATVNYPAGQPDCNGHSTVFDGVAYSEACPQSRDTLVLEAGENEGVYLAPLDLEALRAYREAEAWGNAYRRPWLYGALTEDRTEPPFCRRGRRSRC